MVSYEASILLIYTGGTIGMIEDSGSGSLKPFDFNQIMRYLPEIKSLGFRIESISFDPPIDSSDVNPEIWVRIARVIEVHYETFDGFVILHGTDTMAYSASALSFMLENLSKPVIFTGAQLPIGALRTDGKENLITSMVIAAARENGKPVVPEVCIFFENKLSRANRTTKVNAEDFNAFKSANYPYLAKSGVHLLYNREYIRPVPEIRPLVLHTSFSNQLALLKLFPGMTPEYLDAVLSYQEMRGLILETYGAGNAPTAPWFLDRIRQAIEREIVVLDVTQCTLGSVEMGLYETSQKLLNAGVVSAYDMTSEAACTKMMILLAQNLEVSEVKMLLNKSLQGEITLP